MGDAVWTSYDLRNFNFQSRTTIALRKLDSHPVLMKDVLLDKNDWEIWFDEALSPSSGENALYIVLCSRAPPVFDGEDAPVSYLSVTRGTWERLAREFHIHRSIMRTIARRVAFFSSSYEDDGRPSKLKIGFTARMSAYLPGDLALSVTYIPSTESTFAVMYGCNDQQMREVEKRARVAGDRLKYPLLLLGIFAELERDRLVAKADQLLDGFTIRSEHLENGLWDPTREMNNEKTQEYLAICLQSRSLVDHIRAVKRQLLKLTTEIDEFGNYFSSHKSEAHPADGKKARRFKKAGVQMKKRVQDIINEYEDKIDECNMIVGNTTLAMQTVWNQIARTDSDLNTRIAQANTTIALETKRESTQMRSIALLTMVYLPFSSVAAIFSMDLFDWGAQDGESVVSKYIWVFAVFAVGLTLITIFAWYRITYRRTRAAEKDPFEQQCKMV